MAGADGPKMALSTEAQSLSVAAIFIFGAIGVPIWW
jgi:hypothetical protein